MRLGASVIEDDAVVLLWLGPELIPIYRVVGQSFVRILLAESQNEVMMVCHLLRR